MAGCSTDALNLGGAFQKAGLQNIEIYEIQKKGDQLYIGTSKNMYRKPLGGTSWQPMGLQGGEVRTFVFLSEDTILASLDYDAPADSETIAKTTNGGESWFPYENGYGGTEYGYLPTDMVVHPQNPDIIYARSAPTVTIGKSTDGGKTWKGLLADWNNPLIFSAFLIKTNPYQSSQVWAGGAGPFSRTNLIMSANEGKDWKSIIDHGLGGVHSIVFYRSRSNTFLVGGGGILKTSDGGKNFQVVYDKAPVIFAFAHSVRNTRIIYAGGRNTKFTLFFAASTDFGETWKTIEMENSPSEIHVNDMISVMENGREVLYFATNKGVYSYTFEK